MGHLRGGDSKNYSLKWQKELLLIHRSLKIFIPAQGNLQSITWRSSEEWHIPSRMDDVDYLVEDNAMDGFCLSSKVDGTMVGPLLEMILDSNCWEGQPMENWHDGVQAGNKMQMLGIFQPPYLPEIQIWLETGYFRQHVWKETLQHNQRDDVARFSGDGLRQ